MNNHAALLLTFYESAVCEFYICIADSVLPVMHFCWWWIFEGTRGIFAQTYKSKKKKRHRNIILFVHCVIK